jgi:cytochrome d ubiquinol oxidase subunit I
MQTPAGFKMVEGRAVLTDFVAAAVNHSTFIRYFHTLIGGWITGALFTAGIGAWYLLKNRYREYALQLVKISLILFVFSGIVQLFLGHGHSVQVAKTQPEKMAAFEGLWETQKGAPLALFGIPDEKNEKTHLAVGVPGLLSYLVYFDSEAEVKGLKEFPKEERPPVFLSFLTYHIMIAIGMFFVLLALVGGYLLVKDKAAKSRWYLKALIFAVPLPYIANETGWIAAEVGRQPWAVYRVLKTVDAASVVVPSWQILLTLLAFIIIYGLIFWVFLKVLLKIIRTGPENVKPAGY